MPQQGSGRASLTEHDQTGQPRDVVGVEAQPSHEVLLHGAQHGCPIRRRNARKGLLVHGVEVSGGAVRSR